MSTYNTHPHRRLNILTNEWILVSPHRAERPWQGKVTAADQPAAPRHDPDCFLCPGNKRASGQKNPQYEKTFVFKNDFSALYVDMPETQSTHSLLSARSEKGACRVLCYTPRHDVTMPLMQKKTILEIINVWIREYKELGGQHEINYVQIFENKGQLMGASNPHPHGQIWANQSVPMLPQKETDTQKHYFKAEDRCLLCDYLAVEKKAGERIVLENREFVCLVPFWAVWPYEVMILPKTHHHDISELSHDQKNQLASLLKKITVRYDNLFQTSFPYSMGIHQAPTDGRDHPDWHFHFHFYPPLLRSATIAKFFVGYELLAMPQRDITPEQSAGQLKELSDLHYSKEK
jgi:UDPglucose--hexose-1-phosphate uridylyltransferase